jgi:hypothetical protein
LRAPEIVKWLVVGKRTFGRIKGLLSFLPQTLTITQMLFRESFQPSHVFITLFRRQNATNKKNGFTFTKYAQTPIPSVRSPSHCLQSLFALPGCKGDNALDSWLTWIEAIAKTSQPQGPF